MTESILKSELEAMMLIAQDTKKAFAYNKGEGTWTWHNRPMAGYESNHPRGDESRISEPFDSFLSALTDAVAPYMEKVKRRNP